LTNDDFPVCCDFVVCGAEGLLLTRPFDVCEPKYEGMTIDFALDGCEAFANAAEIDNTGVFAVYPPAL
jgi:hypothetical protein